MTELTLFDHPASSNALKVRFALAEMELAYRRVEVPITRPRVPEYVGLNPFAGIPAISDGSFVLSESQAILRYLARRAGREDLYPTEPREQARVDEFLDRLTSVRNIIFRYEAAALGYTPDGGFDARPRDPEGAARLLPEIGPALALLEAVVTPRAAVLDRFTIADCAIAVILFRTISAGLPLDDFPRLAGLRETLLARPAWLAAEPVI